MSLLDETVSVPRRTMTLFFMIDTSGSMAGSKIGAVNDAVVNVLPMLDEISVTNPDAEIKVAALEFSTGCNWLYNEPKLASEFVWQDVQANGLTSLGAACEEGLAKLKANNWFKSAIKVAIAIGDDADKEVLAKFTGTNEAVFTVHNIDALKQIIRVVAVTSSQIGSKSSAAGDATKQDQVISEVQNAVDNIDGAEVATKVDGSSYSDDWD